ncbi:hypothetical protein U14_05567 [Candidatus Moduliflexus flocculans]|uniref:Uncharacterized protein n=1 Tax=Candidatus Moduliflexus flocculans TaxID=1499966 RepID=A0A081BSA6_9BACT|nr:hypothetical protein U14_05567 [Candidatus Moduliflexus flocculans]
MVKDYFSERKQQGYMQERVGKFVSSFLTYILAVLYDSIARNCKKNDRRERKDFQRNQMEGYSRNKL